MAIRKWIWIFVSIFCVCILAGFSSCTITGNGSQSSSLEYASEWSYDDTHHWHACIEKGYEHLRADEEKHTDTNERVLRPATNTLAGLGKYDCSVCGHTYEKPIYLATEITTLPTIATDTIYVGQTLADVTLSGGAGSVDGTFAWTNPSERISGSKTYSVTFTPTKNDLYATVEAFITITATQLTVTVTSGENGTATPRGVVNVDYNGTLTVSFTPNADYVVDEVTVDGKTVATGNSYTFTKITANATLTVTFKEDNSSFRIQCLSGTPNAYTVENNTVTFTTLTMASAYSISGTLDGNIVIDTGDSYKFDLEFHGFTLTSSNINPITVLSGDEVSLKAKNGYDNYIYDTREAVDPLDTTVYSAAVYALVDLEIAGKGTLTVESTNNNGIHTKDDLQVKNLTLNVTCKDNALKGNDSVSLEDGITTLIAKQGDCIKTTNSHISTTTSEQKGVITVAGGIHTLYAACDGIDAAYDVVINNSASLTVADTETKLHIYTDKYSPYSEEITAVTESSYYLRYNSNAYKYSVKYYNNDSDYLWVNASDTYETVTSSSNRPGGSGSTYYYYTVAKNSAYSKLAVYMYTSSQTQGQDSSYYACSSYQTQNASYDTIALSYRNSSLTVSWTNYSTSTTGGGMGGMQEGNTDKGTYSTKGIKAENQITVNAGVITVQSYDDAIHASNTAVLENGSSPLGNVTINGGTLTLSSNDDGLHADNEMTVAGGTVTVTGCYEGVEGACIYVRGGSISVTSLDDGMNATNTTGSSINILGGNVYVYAGGDGIDSNSTTSKGAITFSGGTTVVVTTSNGNSAIDSDGGFNHTGGRVIAIMPSGAMTSESTNGNSTGMKSGSTSAAATYFTVSVNSTLVVAIKMPVSISSAFAVYLGSNSASFSTASSLSNTFDANGVYWS